MKKITQLDKFRELSNVPLVFEVECINTRSRREYDLRSFQKTHKLLAHAFAYSLLNSKFLVGNLSREGYLAAIRRFYRFLDESYPNQGEIKPNRIDEHVLIDFAHWLRTEKSTSYKTSSQLYRSFIAVVKHWHGKRWAGVLAIPPYLFPKANLSQRNQARAYSEDEINQIVRAVRQDITTLRRKYREYVPRFLGLPPPLEDVAPFNENLRGPYQHSVWHSEEYRIWWWENRCSHTTLSISEVIKIQGGVSFIHGLMGIWNDRKHASLKGGKQHLEEFYRRIGAGPNYSPRYRESACPIKYSTRWQKFDYLHWYWENNLGYAAKSMRELRVIDPTFYQALREYYGHKFFFSQVGIHHSVTLKDIIPIYIGLLLTTGLNPSTIQNLSVDCLRPDPFDADKIYIAWEKPRARRIGQTIPSEPRHGLSPATLVRLAAMITKPFRVTEKKLFITNTGTSNSPQGTPLSKTLFSATLGEWFRDHHITFHDPSSDLPQSTKGEGRRFRGTLAAAEYARTGTLHYVQAILGHSRMETTSEYIKRNEVGILKFQRAIHLNALVLGTDGDWSAAENLLAAQGLGKQDTKSLSIGKDSESLIAHCRDPQNPPENAGSKGGTCTSFNFCLYCANLVVTPYDLVRHFSYVSKMEHLRSNNLIPAHEFEYIIQERIYMFETYIIPRYSAETVNSCRRIAADREHLDTAL